jgi:hypothetical protein
MYGARKLRSLRTSPSGPYLQSNGSGAHFGLAEIHFHYSLKLHFLHFSLYQKRKLLPRREQEKLGWLSCLTFNCSVGKRTDEKLESAMAFIEFGWVSQSIPPDVLLKLVSVRREAIMKLSHLKIFDCRKCEEHFGFS